jgi:hypothetical protein
MAQNRGKSTLARRLQSSRYAGGWSDRQVFGRLQMTATTLSQRVFASVSALVVSFLFVTAAMGPVLPLA